MSWKAGDEAYVKVLVVTTSGQGHWYCLMPDGAQEVEVQGDQLHDPAALRLEIVEEFVERVRQLIERGTIDPIEYVTIAPPLKCKDAIYYAMLEYRKAAGEEVSDEN